MWIECHSGRSALNGWINSIYNTMSNFPQVAPIGEPVADDLFNLSIYFRSTLTLHVLRVRIGDESFFATAREWNNRFACRNATTEDFIALAEEVSGQDLTDLLTAWLFETELPPHP